MPNTKAYTRIRTGGLYINEILSNRTWEVEPTKRETSRVPYAEILNRIPS